MKSPETTVRRRTATAIQNSTTVRRCSETRGRRSLPDCYDNRQSRRSQQHRRMQTYPQKRCPYRWRNSSSRSRCDKRCRSRDTCSSGLRSVIHHRGKQAPRDRKHEKDVDMDLDGDVESGEEEQEQEQEEQEEEEDKELEMEIEDCDYDGDDDNINDDDFDNDNDQVEDDGDEYEEQSVSQWSGAREKEHKRSDVATFTCGWGPQPPVREMPSRVVRCSANVVLLAHGNRSLYVLTIQRNQVTSVVSTYSGRHRNCRSSSSTVISYKLPGGQFILTDDEQKNYNKDGRNTCTCPNDEKWYSAAINHFMTQLTTRGPTATTTTMATTTGQAVDERPQFMPLGNWYRTQKDDDYQATLAAGGVRYKHRRCSNSNYYPYKPAHVSRRLAGHKRVYAVPDACHLFPGAEHTFQLQTPHAKTKTTTERTKTAAAKTKTTTVTVNTTYKCKFVPLARLHENSRLYGPVLSSLPAVLSSMNLICSP